MLAAIAIGIAISLALLVPLALKWQLPIAIVLAWGVALGGVSAAVWTALFGEPGGWVWIAGHAASVAGLSAVAAAWAFLRDPERQAPAERGAIVSPADGVVVYVREFSGGQAPPVEKKRIRLSLPELTQVPVCDEGHLVGISMHLLNVHVNRAPIAGRVEAVRHVHGQFLSLRREEAVTANERVTTLISAGAVQIAVIQIASRLVRRIVSYVGPGQSVGLGERIGMIRFGSQVDVVIPKMDSMTLAVRPGDMVRAGESVLARFGPNDTGNDGAANDRPCDAGGAASGGSAADGGRS